MEGGHNENKESKSMIPTKLQKRAPAGLHLDLANDDFSFFPFPGDESSSSSGSAIPLLSPLAFAPPMQPQESQKGWLGNASQNGKQQAVVTNENNNNSALANAASSLPSFFQSQCVIVENNRSQ